MSTFAFKNKGGYWSTRYSYNAFNYSKINRDLISVPKSNQTSLWLHGPKSKTGAEKTSYYGLPPAGSGISFTFNENVSANKIYKNLSIEGSIGPSNVTRADLTINDSTDPTQLRPTNVRGWSEKAAHIHANVGRSNEMTRSTITPVGRIKGIYQVFFPENQNINSTVFTYNGIDVEFTGGIWGWGYNSLTGLPGFGESAPDSKTLPEVINDPESVDILNAAGQEYLANLFNIDKIDLWDDPDKSPYYFIDIEFFGNYRGSSQKTKYLIKSGAAPGYIGIDDPYSYSFDDLPVFLDGYTRGLLNSPNRVTFDTTPQEWTEPSGGSPGGYVQFGSKKTVREGILCSISNDYILSICDVKWPTVTPGEPVSACDFNFNERIDGNDLLGILGVRGTYDQPNPDLYNIEYSFDPTPEFWDEIYGELLLNYGADIGSIGNPADYAEQMTNAIETQGAVFTLYAATPGDIDGEYARGNYVDMILNLKGNFELDAINLDYEPTTLDHSR